MEQAEFSKRRRRLFDSMAENSIAIFFASNESIRNGDVHYPFRQESNFFYYTGFNEPCAVAVFLTDCPSGRYILFNRPSDPKIERWLGPLAGQQGACEQFNADLSFDISLIDEKIIEFLIGKKTIHYLLSKNKQWDNTILRWVSKLEAVHRQRGLPSIQLTDIGEISSEMRLIKNAKELEVIERVASISSAAHRAAIEICRPALYEFELEACLNYTFMKNGCRFSAYPAIVGGGQNACILHYVDNNCRLRAGDLVLVDAGGELDGYAADITRTYPVNGKFTWEQAAIYDLVLAAQTAVISAIQPGLAWNKLQEIAVRILTEGLFSLGILKNPVAEAISQKIYSAYYMHNIGHWLGLDVHDCGTYQVDNEWRKLVPGMVLTVEPGLYFLPNKTLDERWWNIGVRIEDDIVVTENGCKIITSDVPKERHEIEQLMAKGALSS